MAAKHFTYTVPSSIEGEPAEVARLAVQQIRQLAAVVAELCASTFVQLRAAGIDPDDENAVASWLATDAGAAATDLVWGAQCFAEVARAL